MVSAKVVKNWSVGYGLDGQHQDIDWTDVEESIIMTEDRDKWRKYVCGVANPRIEDV